MNTDTDAIADSIGELIGGYNNLISVTANDANEHFEGNEKLKGLCRHCKILQPPFKWKRVKRYR